MTVERDQEYSVAAGEERGKDGGARCQKYGNNDGCHANCSTDEQFLMSEIEVGDC